MSLLTTLLPIVRSVFSRWTALQLAVNHSMGGPDSEGKYEAFINALAQYLVRHVRPPLSVSSIEQEIQEYLEEVLDEEFNTVLDDGSSAELAQMFVRYVQLIQQGKLTDVQNELQLLQAATPAVQTSVRTKTEDGSSSSSDDDDDGDEGDAEMREEPSTTDSKSQDMDVDEDGWTTVHRRGGGGGGRK